MRQQVTRSELERAPIAIAVELGITYCIPQGTLHSHRREALRRSTVPRKRAISNTSARAPLSPLAPPASQTTRSLPRHLAPEANNSLVLHPSSSPAPRCLINSRALGTDVFGSVKAGGAARGSGGLPRIGAPWGYGHTSGGHAPNSAELPETQRGPEPRSAG